MNAERLEKVRKVLSETSSSISDIEKKRNSRFIAFICHQSVTSRVAYLLNKVVRRLGDVETLDFLIDSGGGDIDATAKIVKILRNHAKRFRSIVPFFAKSAATLLAVSADEVIMCKSGELGLVDPMIRDPTTGIWVPAHSIREALHFIEETKDPLIKLSMADKLPPLLMGGYRSAQNVSRQYMEEAFEKLGDKKDEAVHTFVDKFLSHGYPIDRDICKEVGLPVSFPDHECDCEFCDLHEKYIDLIFELGHKEEGEKRESEEEEGEEEEIEGPLIIQTSTDKCVNLDGEDISSLI